MLWLGDLNQAAEWTGKQCPSDCTAVEPWPKTPKHKKSKHQNISMSRVLRTHLSLQNGSLVKVNHTNTKLTRANTSHGGDLTLVLVHAVDDLDPTLDQVNIKVNDLELHHGLDHQNQKDQKQNHQNGDQRQQFHRQLHRIILDLDVVLLVFGVWLINQFEQMDLL